jgi:hypothetical protein
MNYLPASCNTYKEAQKEIMKQVWTADICRYFLCVMPAGAICPYTGRQMQTCGHFSVEIHDWRNHA